MYDRGAGCVKNIGGHNLSSHWLEQGYEICGEKEVPMSHHVPALFQTIPNTKFYCLSIEHIGNFSRLLPFVKWKCFRPEVFKEKIRKVPELFSWFVFLPYWLLDPGHLTEKNGHNEYLCTEIRTPSSCLMLLLVLEKKLCTWLTLTGSPRARCNKVNHYLNKFRQVHK